MYFVLSIPEHYHRIITQPCNLLYYLSSAYIIILGIHCPDPDLTLSDIKILHYFLYILLSNNVVKSELNDNNIVDVSCILYFYEQKMISMKNV